MQRGEVDLCIVGTDRTLSTGDVANKLNIFKGLLRKITMFLFTSTSKLDYRLSIKDFKKIHRERNSEELS